MTEASSYLGQFLAIQPENCSVKPLQVTVKPFIHVHAFFFFKNDRKTSQNQSHKATTLFILVIIGEATVCHSVDM